jgi:hypothetical protein
VFLVVKPGFRLDMVEVRIVAFLLLLLVLLLVNCS